MELVGDLVSGILTAALTLGVIVAAVLMGGIVLVSRRRQRPERELSTQRTQAGVALVQADDAIQNAERELDFALAQFGERDTAGFRAALGTAKSERDEVFRLHRMLDDDPEPGLRQRERADRITMLAGRIERGLGEQVDQFRQRRTAESGARERLTRLRERAEEVRARFTRELPAHQQALTTYTAQALGPAARAPELVVEHLTAATGLLDLVDDRLAGSTTAPVTADLDEADTRITSALRLLDDRAVAVQRLDEVTVALGTLTTDARTQRSEALEAAGSAPDADTADGITRAVADLDSALATAERADARDPLPTLSRLRASLDALEVALAASRSQAQRLSHARDAEVLARY